MIRARPALIALVANLAAPAISAERTSLSLFDGKSLAGWEVVGDKAWTVADGIASADTGAPTFLVTQRSYGDFELRVEVWVSHDANSGIFIRCANPSEINATSCYEVNLFDNRPDPTYGTGAIVGLAAVSPMPKAGGRWNTMVITAHGDRFSVILNGRETVSAARDSTRASGVFALQRAAGTVRFRKIAIRPL